jgi:tetratricopeptide (TPR) repeat protein
VLEQDTGQLREAATSFRRAIEISRTVQGDPNRDLARFYAYLSEVEYRLQDIPAAERTARLAHQTAIAINGEDHADAVQTEIRLGRVLFDTGRTLDGLAHFRSASQRSLRIPGGNDALHTPQALLEYGHAQVRMGLPKAGLADIEAAIAINRANRPGSVFLAVMLELAASALVDMGRVEQAMTYLDEATALKLKGGLEPRSARFNANTGARIRLALATDQVELARVLLDDLFVDVDRTNGISFTATEKMLTTAEVDLAAGLPGQSTVVAREVRADLEASGLIEYLDFPAARADFIEGLAALRNNHPDLALPLLLRALDTRKGLMAASSPRIAEVQIALAACRLALGQREAAESMALAAETIHALHEELGQQFRKPLADLRTRLSTPTGS